MNMKNNTKEANIGLALVFVITLASVVTKLAGSNSLSWFWVFSPVWIYVLSISSIVLLVLYMKRNG
tara:strand:- start:7591 stop:7788 length:198 start_codon:yes stop_codon:yes gene_type:complete